MKKRIVVLLLAATVLCLGICGCSAPEQQSQTEPAAVDEPPALSQANRALMNAAFYDSPLEVTYDEDADKLSLVIGGDADHINEIFDTIDKAVDGKDIGTLSAYIEWGWVPNTGIAAEREKQQKAMLPVLSKRIGELPCASLKGLDVGRLTRDLADSELYDGSWTKALTKTDTLDLDIWGGTYSFSRYTDEERENLLNVKRLVVGDRYEGGYYETVPNVEELVFSADDDEEEKEETARQGLEWKSNSYDHAGDLVDLGSIKRVLFFPELESWTESDGYYLLLMTLQATHPDVLTNKPGSGWDGDEGSLVAVEDVDVRKALGDEEYKAAKDILLKVTAKTAFMAAQDYPQKSGQPKLDGPTLVYRMLNPYNLEWSDYTQFSSNGDVLIDEFADTSLKMPTDDFKFDYLVYAYPTFSEAGEYMSGTKAYATTVWVQVYDIKNGVKYEPVQVDEVQPPETRIYDSDDKEAPEPNDEAIASYVAGLAK